MCCKVNDSAAIPSTLLMFNLSMSTQDFYVIFLNQYAHELHSILAVANFYKITSLPIMILHGVMIDFTMSSNKMIDWMWKSNVIVSTNCRTWDKVKSFQPPKLFNGFWFISQRALHWSNGRNNTNLPISTAEKSCQPLLFLSYSPPSLTSTTPWFSYKKLHHQSFIN